jgi:hypothetical protein
MSNRLEQIDIPVIFCMARERITGAFCFPRRRIFFPKIDPFLPRLLFLRIPITGRLIEVWSSLSRNLSYGNSDSMLFFLRRIFGKTIMGWNVKAMMGMVEERRQEYATRTP